MKLEKVSDGMKGSVPTVIPSRYDEGDLGIVAIPPEKKFFTLDFEGIAKIEWK